MRVSEVYASVQGEGPNVGKTTVFVRFGGCNLRCPGWPCDTQHAIDPKYRKEWADYDPETLFAETFKIGRMAGAKQITLTGGEPFLQRNSELMMFVDALKMSDFNVEAFTNGTRPYTEWFVEEVDMIMDWKLPGSGEDPLNKVRVENLKLLLWSNNPRHAIKFVCKDMHDMITAHSLWSSHLEERERADIETFYGRVWESSITDAKLAEYVMKNRLPWRLNRQEHNYIWPANERGR